MPLTFARRNDFGFRSNLTDPPRPNSDSIRLDFMRSNSLDRPALAPLLRRLRRRCRSCLFLFHPFSTGFSLSKSRPLPSLFGHLLLLPAVIERKGIEARVLKKGSELRHR